MEGLIEFYNAIKGNFGVILSAAAHLCLLASIIVKLTPTVKDDAYLKPIIKFIGKYVALDKYSPPK